MAKHVSNIKNFTISYIKHRYIAHKEKIKAQRFLVKMFLVEIATHNCKAFKHRELSACYMTGKNGRFPLLCESKNRER